MTGAKYKENLDLMLHKDKEHANEEIDANVETEDPQEKKSVLKMHRRELKRCTKLLDHTMNT